MGRVLTKTKEILARALIDTQKIVNKNNVRATFSLQIIAYRNYSSLNDALICSGFETDPTKLTLFMGQIKALGGDGYEQALEMMYRRINEIEEVHQVIIIGDAPCHTRQEMIRKRNNISPSRDYWNSINVPFV